MASQTSTPSLTGITSAGSADNAPTDSSSLTKSWNYTEMIAGNGNFPIPFQSHPPRTSRNRNSSTESQYHKTTEDKGEVKDAIPKSAGMTRREVAGNFQARRENDKKKMDRDGGQTHAPKQHLESQ